MIPEMVDVLPHGLVNNVDVLGSDGSLLLEYISWLKNRISPSIPTDLSANPPL